MRGEASISALKLCRMVEIYKRIQRHLEIKEDAKNDLTLVSPFSFDIYLFYEASKAPSFIKYDEPEKDDCDIFGKNLMVKKY